jgi:ParB family chromosome partitioning protein
MKYETRRLVDLRVYQNNPRINTNAVPKVKESIKRYGYKVPIVIDRNNVIVAGHTRFSALLEINEETGQYSEISVVIADDLTEDQIKQFRIVDNQVASIATWDFTALKLELDDIDDFVLNDFGDITGFDVIDLHDEEPNLSSDTIKIKIGAETIELTEAEYYDWAKYISDTKGISLVEFVRTALEIDPRNRQYEEMSV